MFTIFKVAGNTKRALNLHFVTFCVGKTKRMLRRFKIEGWLGKSVGFEEGAVGTG